MDLDNKIPGSLHFTWREALYLPSWNCCHIPSIDEQNNIIKMAATMDKVRRFLNKPISVHCWIRPILNNPNSPHHGEDYNKFKGGATSSAHKTGNAVDWDCGEDCDVTRAKLLSKLAEYRLRMENKQHSDWVHLDTRTVPVGGNRYFSV